LRTISVLVIRDVPHICSFSGLESYILAQRPGGTRPHGEPRLTWEEDNKVDLKI
jgi:hypothetical protein